MLFYLLITFKIINHTVGNYCIPPNFNLMLVVLMFRLSDATRAKKPKKKKMPAGRRRRGRHARKNRPAAGESRGRYPASPKKRGWGAGEGATKLIIIYTNN